MTIQRRLYAFIIDYVLGSVFISIVPMFITSIITQEKAFTVETFTSMPLSWQAVCGIAAFGAAVYYFVIYPVHSRHPGQTPGKRAMKIRVVTTGGGPLSCRHMIRRELVGSMIMEGETAFPSAFFRYFIYRLIPGEGAGVLQTTALGLSLLSVFWAVFHPSHRMFHDYVGGTRVCSIREGNG